MVERGRLPLYRVHEHEPRFTGHHGQTRQYAVRDDEYVHSHVVLGVIRAHVCVTVVLTTIWCELMADPKLFLLRRVKVWHLTSLVSTRLT